MTTINKSELIDQVAEADGVTKADAKRSVDTVLATIAKNLASGSEIRLSGFGVFSVTKRDARPGRNPVTGAEIQIAASKNVKFKAGKELKDKL